MPEPEDPVAARRANDLDGAEWTRTSISVWSDLRKLPEEARLKHPALFPQSLVTRLIRCLTRDGDGPVLDPFCGSGSTLVAALSLGREALGFEISPDYRALIRARIDELGPSLPEWRLLDASAEELERHLAPRSVALCITSPPYWDVLARPRSADRLAGRDYTGAEGGLGETEGYEDFVQRLAAVFAQVGRCLRPGGYCVVNVMDLRKKSQFFPLHADLMRAIPTGSSGTLYLDDLIIWDRRQEYNRFRPLGYPAVFRINKAHEYLLIFRRPVQEADPSPRKKSRAP